MFCSIAITHYRQYGEFVENFYLVATFKDYKKDGVNLDKKNSGVDADKKDVKDDEGDVEDSVIDIKSIIDFNTNVVNSGEDNKDVRNTISVLPAAIRKRVNNANKGAWRVKKRVDDADKGEKEIEKRVSDANKSARISISNILGEVRKSVNNQGNGNRISVFPGKVGKRIVDNALVNNLVDVVENSFDDLDLSLICVVADFIKKLYIYSAIPAIVDISAKLPTNPAIPTVINTLNKFFINCNVMVTRLTNHMILTRNLQTSS